MVHCVGIIVLALLAAMLTVIGSRTCPYLSGQIDQVAYYHQFQAGEFVADESLEVANYLRQHVAPGDSLFIWGFRPEVYYLSQLEPGGALHFPVPAGGELVSAGVAAADRRYSLGGAAALCAGLAGRLHALGHGQ